MMETELKMCPFCGSDNVSVSTSDDNCPRWVACANCGCDGPPIDYRFTGTNDEAYTIVVRAWNTRRNGVT